MNKSVIDGASYVKMLIGGASKLTEHIEELNAMNVFPVADGDTGTNMSRTIEGGLSEVLSESDVGIDTMLSAFAKGALLAARGNSGVILSQIFAGISEGMKKCECADARAFAEAYKNGIAKSYAAVQNPTEGTILSVFRESVEYACSSIDEHSTVEDFFRLHIERAREALEKTPELLPALAEAGVVDSGAAGYLCIAEGMYEALSGKEVVYHIKNEPKSESKIDINSFTRDSVLEFGYCTEFLLRLTTSKVTDPDAFELSRVLDILDELHGESIVAYKQDDIIKVHVHTFTPGEILNRMQAFGEFLTVKIENMSVGHTESEKNVAPKPTKPKSVFSVVAVACGEGISALFSDLGADEIINGGQTQNPSAEDFINAFKKCNSDHIIVLPNNKNIILAAHQASELYQDANVHIIETKSIPEGFSALSVITKGVPDVESVIQGAVRAKDSMIDCEVTRAIRDAVVDGINVSEGEYMAISNHKLTNIAGNPEDAVIGMLDTVDTDLSEIITLFVGADVNEDRRLSLTGRLEELYPDLEINVYNGGQSVYDYYLAIE